jgi:hypothetical protein
VWRVHGKVSLGDAGRRARRRDWDTATRDAIDAMHATTTTTTTTRFTATAGARAQRREVRDDDASDRERGATSRRGRP